MLEFMRDYDKLRSGRIPATSFRRALDLCGLSLGQEEVTALEKMSVTCGHEQLYNTICSHICMCTLHQVIISKTVCQLFQVSITQGPYPSGVHEVL